MAGNNSSEAQTQAITQQVCCLVHGLDRLSIHARLLVANFVNSVVVTSINIFVLSIFRTIVELMICVGYSGSIGVYIEMALLQIC